MTAQGAAADNACRDGAPRGARAASQRARAPRAPHPLQTLGPGSSACEAGRSQGWPKGADRKAPWAPPGAPSLSYGEGRKTGRRAHLGVRKNKAPGQRSVGLRKLETATGSTLLLLFID